MGRGSLPPGFRFHPTDVELVRYYLKRKVSGKKLHFDAIAEIDIYKYAPWDLPHKSLLRSGDLKWYFFCPRETKYASGGRMNRATSFGFWKTTGKDRCVYYKDEVAGMIKTLVFHTGKAPKGDRTDWVMYEYRLEDKELSDIKDSYVLSVVFKKEGPGPRNGAQYGAPFNEEEWDDDNDEEVAANVLESLSFVGGFTPPAVLPVNQNIPITTSSHVPVSVCKESSMSAPSKKLPPLNSPLNIDSDNDASSNASLLVNGGDDGSYAGTYGPPSFYPITQCNPSGIRSSASYPSEMLPPVTESLRLFSDNDVPCAKDSQALPEDDELLSMLDAFSDEHNMIENVSDQKLGGNFDGDSWLDDVDFFNGLGQFTVDGTSNCYNTNDAVEKMLQCGDGQYLELSDLNTPLSFPMEATEQVLSGGLYVENNSHHPANPYHATQLVTELGQSPILPEDFYRYQDQMNAFSKEKANYGYDVPEASLCQDSAVTRLSQDMGSGCPFDATGDIFGGMQNGFSYMGNLHR